MIKKILSILLIGLLVMSSMGGVSATVYYYHYTCHVGDKITPNRIMEDLGDPTYMSMEGLYHAIDRCPYLKGTRDNPLSMKNEHFEVIKPGIGRYKVESWIGDDDFLDINVIRK
jgi:hypothetical protein